MDAAAHRDGSRRAGSAPAALPHPRALALHHLVAELSAGRIGATFNQYRESDADDCGSAAPRIRRENLIAYLEARLDAPVLLVAEAAGWRGARYSGLCLYSERQFTVEEPRLRRSSAHPRGWTEPSATVMQAAIAPWRQSVVLWNLVPTHPRREGMPHSNRTPTRGEMAQGACWLERLREVLRPRYIGAIGAHASRALGSDVPAVRHPAHGGAAACTIGVRALLTNWLG